MAVETKKATSKKERELLEACRLIEKQVELVRSLIRFIDDNPQSHLVVCNGLFMEIKKIADSALNAEGESSWI